MCCPRTSKKCGSIILSQSCDAENQKVEDVLVAQVFSRHAVVRQELERNDRIVTKREFRKRLIEGNQPGQALLHKHDDPRLEWSIVGFHRLYTVQEDFFVQFASGSSPRLRVRPPYREHIARIFARFGLRVGLPHDAKVFETEGDVKRGEQRSECLQCRSTAALR